MQWHFIYSVVPQAFRLRGPYCTMQAAIQCDAKTRMMPNSRAGKRGGFKRGRFPIWTCPFQAPPSYGSGHSRFGGFQAQDSVLCDVLCGDASCLFLGHFSKHLSSVLGWRELSRGPESRAPNNPKSSTTKTTIWHCSTLFVLFCPFVSFVVLCCPFLSFFLLRDFPDLSFSSGLGLVHLQGTFPTGSATQYQDPSRKKWEPPWFANPPVHLVSTN